MKKYTVLLMLCLGCALFTVAEYCSKYPFKLNVWILSIGAVIVALGCFVMFERTRWVKSITYNILGGAGLISLVLHVDNFAQFMLMYLNGKPDIPSDALLAIVFAISLFYPVSIGCAIWFYFYYFCDLDNYIRR